MADNTSQNNVLGGAQMWCSEWTKEVEQPEEQPSLAFATYRWCGEWTTEAVTEEKDRFDDLVTAKRNTSSLPPPSLPIVTYSDADTATPAGVFAEAPRDESVKYFV